MYSVIFSVTLPTTFATSLFGSGPFLALIEAIKLQASKAQSLG